MVSVTEGNRKLPCMYSTNTKTSNKSIGQILDRDAVSIKHQQKMQKCCTDILLCVWGKARYIQSDDEMAFIDSS